MTDELIRRLRTFGLASFDDRRDAAALIEDQAAALEAANARIAELESERDALANSLAAAKQDASTAWERHAMANRIGNAAADELATARGRIADLEVQLVNANDAWLSLSQAAPQPLEAQADARWQPIETAPKDGTTVDLWVGGEFAGRRASCFWGFPLHDCGEHGRYCDSDWHDLTEGWVDDMNMPLSEDRPTHWMLLPAAPAVLSQKAGGQG